MEVDDSVKFLIKLHVFNNMLADKQPHNHQHAIIQVVSVWRDSY